MTLVGCDNKPTQDKSSAKVAEAVATASASAAMLPNAVAYKFSNSDSKLEWLGAKVTGKHGGTFGTFSGMIQVVDNDPTKSQVSVEIDVTSLKSEPEKLVTHLKGADFFDVSKFPKAKFTSTSVKTGGDKGASHTVTGNLEMHGVTKSISFPATIKVAGDKVDVDAEFGINRKDFGVAFAGRPDDLIKDEVLITLSIRSTKK